MRDILHIIVYSLEEFIYSCEGVLMIDINVSKYCRKMCRKQHSQNIIFSIFCIVHFQTKLDTPIGQSLLVKPRSVWRAEISNYQGQIGPPLTG